MQLELVGAAHVQTARHGRHVVHVARAVHHRRNRQGDVGPAARLPRAVVPERQLVVGWPAVQLVGRPGVQPSSVAVGGVALEPAVPNHDLPIQARDVHPTSVALGGVAAEDAPAHGDPLGGVHGPPTQVGLQRLVADEVAALERQPLARDRAPVPRRRVVEKRAVRHEQQRLRGCPVAGGVDGGALTARAVALERAALNVQCAHRLCERPGFVVALEPRPAHGDRCRDVRLVEPQPLLIVRKHAVGDVGDTAYEVRPERVLLESAAPDGGGRRVDDAQTGPRILSEHRVGHRHVVDGHSDRRVPPDGTGDHDAIQTGGRPQRDDGVERLPAIQHGRQRRNRALHSRHLVASEPPVQRHALRWRQRRGHRIVALLDPHLGPGDLRRGVDPRLNRWERLQPAAPIAAPAGDDVDDVLRDRARATAAPPTGGDLAFGRHAFGVFRTARLAGLDHAALLRITTVVPTVDRLRGHAVPGGADVLVTLIVLQRLAVTGAIHAGVEYAPVVRAGIAVVAVGVAGAGLAGLGHVHAPQLRVTAVTGALVAVVTRFDHLVDAALTRRVAVGGAPQPVLAVAGAKRIAGQLCRVGDQRTRVLVVGHRVPIDVGVARVPDPIGVQIRLPRIGHARTVAIVSRDAIVAPRVSGRGVQRPVRARRHLVPGDRHVVLAGIDAVHAGDRVEEILVAQPPLEGVLGRRAAARPDLGERAGVDHQVSQFRAGRVPGDHRHAVRRRVVVQRDSDQ